MKLSLLLFFFFLTITVLSETVATDELSSSKLKFSFYLREDGERMMVAIHAPTNGTYRMVDCYLYGDRSVIEKSISRVTKQELLTVNKDEMVLLMNICTDAKLGGSLPHASYFNELLRQGFIDRWFIYPGTKWCGAGNISSGYDDLGIHKETDKCCREHDYCPDSLPAFGSNHGLQNYSPITKSNCDCDDKFYSCLQAANTETSNRIGKIYFNVLLMECFRMDFPIVKCLEYEGALPFHRACQKYELNTDEEPIWQFFDAKHYKETDTEDPDESENEITENHLQRKYSLPLGQYSLKI